MARLKKKKNQSKEISDVTDSTEMTDLDDRLVADIEIRKTTKNVSCPNCKTFPTITKIRRAGYELRRCRECGHRFEIKDKK